MPLIRREEMERALALLAPGVKRTPLTIEGFHRAGVLVPLILDGESVELLFTKRTEDVETHKGQISFPGGMADAGDVDIVQTAVREAEEELGIAPALVTVRGLLDDMAVPSGFVITPVVATLEVLPAITPNPREVAEVFTVPLAFFLDPANGRTEIREAGGIRREVWFYSRGEHTIWGATAGIVRSLVVQTGLLRD